MLAVDRSNEQLLGWRLEFLLLLFARKLSMHMPTSVICNPVKECGAALAFVSTLMLNVVS